MQSNGFQIAKIVKLSQDYSVSSVCFAAKTCDCPFVSKHEPSTEEVGSTESDENNRFNGAELSESVLGRDWSSPQEEAAWSNL